MLSKELKDMEMNRLVKRTVLNTQPIAVQYELTEYGQSLKSVIDNLSNWGVEHRKKIIMEQ
jgi:DNA-binding HxlR family transcriptional regulator